MPVIILVSFRDVLYFVDTSETHICVNSQSFYMIPHFYSTMLHVREMCLLIARDSFIFRRQQLEQSVYCEPESRRATTADDDRQDVQGANHEKVKVSQPHYRFFEREHSSCLDARKIYGCD